jgi:branched-chain amino acid transport system ATP-binding protein
MARRLSGDEQLMPIGRVLMINPQLLVLDEATEGLAPLIREDVWRCLTALKRTGQSIFVIDKDIDALIEVADHYYVIARAATSPGAERREFAAAPDG